MMKSSLSVTISVPSSCSEAFHAISPDLARPLGGCKVELYSDSFDHIRISSDDSNLVIRMVRSIGVMMALSYRVMKEVG